MLASEPPTADTAVVSAEAEAARYALLRRLAPSMRHHLVVNLQPIGMIYEVMDRRLRVPVPDLANIQESAGKINGFARAALNSCLDVVGWLAPDATARTSVPEGARECASLLATSLSFRGYSLRNQVPELAGDVRRSAFRTLLTAALVHATDHEPPPADLVLGAEAGETGVTIVLSVKANQGERGFPSERNYRVLTWGDLRALAASEGVEVQRADAGLRLMFPWAAAAPTA
jgi:hypothetical protein